MQVAFIIAASVLACTAVLISNPTANAQESKPSTTTAAAVSLAGTAIFDGHVFEYKIIDRGVRTNGHLFPRPALITSERNYVLSYQPKGAINGPLLWSSAEAIHADADARCKELANVEMASIQKSDASDAVKKAAAQRTHLIRPPITKTYEPTVNYESFVCSAIVVVQLP